MVSRTAVEIKYTKNIEREIAHIKAQLNILAFQVTGKMIHNRTLCGGFLLRLLYKSLFMLYHSYDNVCRILGGLT